MKIEAGVLNPAPIIKGASEVLNIIFILPIFIILKQILLNEHQIFHKIAMEYFGADEAVFASLL